MISIRTFLLGVIVTGWVLVNFLVLLKGYENGSNSTELLLDEQLIDLAHLLAKRSAVPRPNEPYFNERFAYQVIHEQRINEASPGLEKHIFAPLEKGFSHANFLQSRWRTFSLFDANTDRWILVAELEKQRLKITESIVLSTLQPLFFGIPLAIIAIWLVIGYGLRPLQNLSQQLHQRQVNNLDPIDLGTLPRELHSVTDSVNQLLNRLQIAFSREKAFVADAAHELRTPVSNLKIHFHNLQHATEHPEKYQDFGDAIDNLAHLVEQLLLLHRSSAEQLTGYQQEIELNAYLQDVIAQHYHDIDSKEHEIELQAQNFRLETNVFALTSIINNGLSNAIKYTPKGGKIRVSTSCATKHIAIVIEDSGPGIPVNERQGVFQRFVRIERANQPPINGSGLGLAIVAEAAKVLGAEIGLGHSILLGGLSFQLTLPILNQSTISRNNTNGPGNNLITQEST